MRAGRAGGVRFPRGWAALERAVRNCTRCPLHATRTHVVLYRGSPAPRVVFVGEAPGRTEDQQGIPFVGRSGRRLDEAIAAAGLPASDFGVLNLIKCRPPDNWFDRRAAATCRPYLDRQLALLRPSLLVSLGAHALRALDPTAPAVLQAAGAPRDLGERQLFPLIHPAAAFRSRAMSARWQRDWETLGRWLARPPTVRLREPS